VQPALDQPPPLVDEYPDNARDLCLREFEGIEPIIPPQPWSYQPDDNALALVGLALREPTTSPFHSEDFCELNGRLFQPL
jgi:hypothetical protein